MDKTFQIVVDSTSDLPVSLAQKRDLAVIPYIFTMGNKEYYNHLDNRDMSPADFYKALSEGQTASTTLVTAFRFVEAWEPFLKDGKDILYICLSSALSKSYDQAVMAAEEMRETYPERKVIAVDSRAASIGQGLLAYYASKAQEKGATIEEVAKKLDELIPRMQHWVMVDDLAHLKRGGRVSGAAAAVGALLSIKPILTITNDGSIVPVAKVKGKKNALLHITDQLSKQLVNVKGQTLGIAHSAMPEVARQLEDMIIAKYGACNCIITDIGPVIGAHTGPGALTLVFVGNRRER